MILDKMKDGRGAYGIYIYLLGKWQLHQWRYIHLAIGVSGSTFSI